MKKYLLLIPGLMLVCSLSAQNKTKLSRTDSFWGLHFDRHLGLSDSHIGATLTEGMIDSLLNMARPDYIQVDCKGHPGVSSYPTAVGQQAASYDKDPLALIRKVTDAHRTGLYVHYSGVKDINYVRLHPEQARLQVNGKPDHANPNVKGIDEIPVLTDLKVSVLTQSNPKSVLLQPEGIPLKYSFINGRTEITLPKLEIHNIIEIN